MVILVGAKQTEPIREGILSTDFNPSNIKTAHSLSEANNLMQEFAQPGDIVLYENDLPDSFDE